METAEIVHDSEQEDRVGDGRFSPGQTMRPTDKRRETGTERTIQALDEGGIDTALALREATEMDEHGT